jgi:hypothetical protein
MLWHEILKDISKTIKMKKILTLVALGVAVKYFLDTERGKELKKQVTDWLGEAEDTVKETFQQATDTIKQAAARADGGMNVKR